MTITEDKKTFDLWYEGFVKDHPGGKSFLDSDYFEKVQTNHKDLRSDLLGGLSASMEFDPKDVFNKNNEKDILKKADEELKKNIDELVKIYPKVLNSVRQTDLYNHSTSYGGVLRKTSRIILGNFNEDQLLKRNVEKILSNMGIWWKEKALASSLFADNVTIILSTKAKVFPMLGNMSADDEQSCFSNRYSSHYQKYNLGASKDTFVVIFKENGKNVGRCWGFLTKSKPNDKYVFNFTNFYVKKGSSYCQLETLLFYFIKELMNKTPKEFYNLCYQNDCGLCFNNDSYTLSMDDEDLVEKPVLNVTKPEWK